MNASSVGLPGTYFHSTTLAALCAIAGTSSGVSAISPRVQGSPILWLNSKFCFAPQIVRHMSADTAHRMKQFRRADAAVHIAERVTHRNKHNVRAMNCSNNPPRDSDCFRVR